MQRRGTFTDERAATLRTAYAIAEAAHAGQKRKSGVPYITHPVHVAEIAAAWDFRSPFCPRPCCTT